MYLSDIPVPVPFVSDASIPTVPIGPYDLSIPPLVQTSTKGPTLTTNQKLLIGGAVLAALFIMRR